MFDVRALAPAAVLISPIVFDARALDPAATFLKEALVAGDGLKRRSSNTATSWAGGGVVFAPAVPQSQSRA